MHPVGFQEGVVGMTDLSAGFPDDLRALLADAQRVVLVANNPAIGKRDMVGLQLGARDVVVYFNNCIPYRLIDPRVVNVFFHGFNVEDRYFFGLPYRPEIAALFQGRRGRCFTVLMGVDEELCPLPDVGYFTGRLPLSALANYPRLDKEGRRGVVPSTGFRVMALFDWLRSHGGFSCELLCLGFSNEAGKLWGGHAWDYERRWVADADVTLLSVSGGWMSFLLRKLGFS